MLGHLVSNRRDITMPAKGRPGWLKRLFAFLQALRH
jgi:hypothetical protein